MAEEVRKPDGIVAELRCALLFPDRGVSQYIRAETDREGVSASTMPSTI